MWLNSELKINFIIQQIETDKNITGFTMEPKGPR